LVRKYGGDVRVRKFRCTEQFRAMAFAQLTFRESLRDIEACLDARPMWTLRPDYEIPYRGALMAARKRATRLAHVA